MSDVKIARNVGRRETDSKLLRVLGLVVGLEELVVFPPRIPIFFDCSWMVGLIHEVGVAFPLDGFFEGELWLCGFVLLNHVGGLFLGLHQLGGIATH